MLGLKRTAETNGTLKGFRVQGSGFRVSASAAPSRPDTDGARFPWHQAYCVDAALSDELGSIRLKSTQETWALAR